MCIRTPRHSPVCGRSSVIYQSLLDCTESQYSHYCAALLSPFRTPPNTSAYFTEPARGQISLLIEIESTNGIVSPIKLKEEVESAINEECVDRVRLIIEGASESNLVARKLTKCRHGRYLDRG